MEKILDLISGEMEKAFEAAGYDACYGKVSLSNRPDLCEYQCNGAMAAVKIYKKAPIMIANEVVEQLVSSDVFAEVTAVPPGFINLKVRVEFLIGYLNTMRVDDNLGIMKSESPKKSIIDYGGPNVAKPLHVGHLRSAIIGESIKRIGRLMGHEVIGDVHLGDWGLQMGLIIHELQLRKPELLYFDENYDGEYPREAPFSLNELEEIYPTASGKSKEDVTYKEKAMLATFQLQQGHRGYQAIWKHIIELSVGDLKTNYEKLNVSFDLWKGESDAKPYIDEMVKMLQDKGYAHLDEGAWVVDVKEESDTKEVPPCLVMKSDGAYLYATTDLATIVSRMKEYQPTDIIYVVDKRQEMHFTQVFRCAKKTGLVTEKVALSFQGFGTMNGKDGKPFKTRDGGVMRLETLIRDINEEMYKKIMDNHEVDSKEARQTAEIVGMAAIKYGDLSNQSAKDYVFDMERFTSFEGNTGPYILYTIVRIKSILNKYCEENGKVDNALLVPVSEAEKVLMLELTKFNSIMENAFEETAPHKICSYVYELANAFNRFYHGTKILVEEDEKQKAAWITLLMLTKDVLEKSIDVLGFTAPERM